MSSTGTYSARFELPDLLEQGRDTELVCRVYREGALVAPTGGTVSVYNASRQVVATGAVTLDGDIATRTVTAAELAAQPRGEGWRVEWTLTMPGGVVHVFGNDASLVRARLYPVVTEADLYRRVRRLDPAGSDPLTTRTDFTAELDEAWTVIQSRLIEAGNRPHLILSPSALREVTLLKWLEIIYDDLASLNESYQVRADGYREQFEAAWTRLSFSYDTNDDGVSDGGGRRGPSASLWVM